MENEKPPSKDDPEALSMEDSTQEPLDNSNSKTDDMPQSSDASTKLASDAEEQIEIEKFDEESPSSEKTTTTNTAASPLPLGISGKNSIHLPNAQAPRTRLSDNAEKIVYFFVLLVGSTIILIGKSMGWLSPWPAAVFAVVCITGYGMFAWVSQRENPVRADRLGDNCYYLGLVYTLASLIASLIAINHGADVNTLLGNFGVALVSTAAGIVARLIMIQLKSETDDIDKRARIALGETAQLMQSDLLSAAATFRHLMLDAQETFKLSVESTSKNINEASKISNQLNQLDLSPERMSNSLIGIVQNLEKASLSIVDAGAKLQAQSETVISAASAVERAENSMTHIHEVLGQISTTLDQHRLATEQALKTIESQSEWTETHARKMEQNAEEARLATVKVYSAMGDLANTVIKRVQK